MHDAAQHRTCRPTGWMRAIFQAASDNIVFPICRTCTRSSVRLMQVVGLQKQIVASLPPPWHAEDGGEEAQDTQAGEG